MNSNRNARWCVLVLLLAGSAVGAEPPAAYVKHCEVCHGADGSGRKTPALGQVPDFRSKKIVALNDDQLYDAIATGTKHQAYAHSFRQIGVSDEELKDLVRYIRELQKPPQRK